jgi:hypothetical protein
MPDLLEQSAAWLEEMRLKFLTRPVTYVREGESITVRATVGRTVFRIARDYGIFERTESRDYLVTADELVLRGNAVLPARGDTIREADGDSVHIYEVMAPGGEPCWRWSDGYRRALRIHTKLVGMEEA